MVDVPGGTGTHGMEFSFLMKTYTIRRQRAAIVLGALELLPVLFPPNNQETTAARCRLFGGTMANTPANYDEYLKTFEWKVRRLRALRDAEHRCQRCGTDKTLEVHHLRYTNLGHEFPEDLIVLCYECHLAEHEDPESKSNKHKNGYRAGLWSFCRKTMNCKYSDLDFNMKEAVEERFRAYIRLPRK